MIKLADLLPNVNYCVVRDDRNRESIVTAGHEIIKGYESNRDYQHFRFDEAVWGSYEKLECDDGEGSDLVYLSIWRDPTRPELNTNRTSSFTEEVAVAQPQMAVTVPVSKPPDGEFMEHIIILEIDAAPTRGQIINALTGGAARCAALTMHTAVAWETVAA